jgi:putative transposase
MSGPEIPSGIAKTGMGNYIEGFYHFVWATRMREWFITERIERPLHRFIRHQCAERRVHVHALNGMPDHLHLAVTLPTTLAVADFMAAIKGTSSHFINHLPDQTDCLYWQPNYGMMLFDLSQLPRIVRYIDGQKTHHQSGTLLAKLERVSDEDDIIPPGPKEKPMG